MNELPLDGSLEERFIAHWVPHSSQDLPEQRALLLRPPLNEQILSASCAHLIVEAGELPGLTYLLVGL